MTSEKVFEIVASTSAELIGIEKSQIKMSSNFRDDLGCDSLSIAELVMVFENKFSLIIPDDDSESFSTVQDVVEYVVKNK